MNHRDFVILGVVACLVLLFVAVWVIQANPASERSPSSVAQLNNGDTASLPLPSQSSEESPYREEAPTNVIVPEKEAKDLPSNIAVPVAVGLASEKDPELSYRKFQVRIEDGKFYPDTVIAKRGDTVRIDLEAVDRAYDFTQPDYGFAVLVPKGETKFAEFSVTASGKFQFFCQSCGGPDSGPTGHIIVAAK